MVDGKHFHKNSMESYGVNNMNNVKQSFTDAGTEAVGNIYRRMMESFEEGDWGKVTNTCHTNKTVCN